MFFFPTAQKSSSKKIFRIVFHKVHSNDTLRRYLFVIFWQNRLFPNVLFEALFLPISPHHLDLIFVFILPCPLIVWFVLWFPLVLSSCFVCILTAALALSFNKLLYYSLSLPACILGPSSPQTLTVILFMLFTFISKLFNIYSLNSRSFKHILV